MSTYNNKDHNLTLTVDVVMLKINVSCYNDSSIIRTDLNTSPNLIKSLLIFRVNLKLTITVSYKKYTCHAMKRSCKYIL